MSKAKSYKMLEGIYYINIKVGMQNITISRNTKEEAINVFYSYKKVGKNPEWLGCWDGKHFKEASVPSQLE